MKALMTVPASNLLTRILYSHLKPAPVPVPPDAAASLRPVEMRRYLRNLRETREYHFTRDFLY